MSSPLPLRVCCMAAMAPALTEAATQARIKLSPGSPPVSSTPSPIVLNGNRDYSKQNGIGRDCPSKTDKFIKRKIPVSLIKINKPEKTVSPFTPRTTDLHVDYSALNYIKIIKGSTSSPYTNGHIANANLPGTNITKVGNTCSMNQPKFGFLGTLKNMGMNGKNENIQANAPLSPSTQGLSETRANGSQVVPDPNADDVTVGESDDLEPDLSYLSRDIVNKQNLLNRKTQYLLRRLRRLQGKRIDSHMKQQIAGFLSHQHNTSLSAGKCENASGTPGDLKTGLLQSEDMKNLSTAALVSLVRKLQSNQSIPLGHHFLNVPKTEKMGVSLDAETKELSKHVSGRLLSVFHSVESTVDSDATESSSGGESCDEADDEKNSKTFTPLCRRAEWKWSADRGAVVSRWTWLQAQVSDLEYRIRQHSDIYKQIRASKGSVLLGESPPASDLLKIHSSGQKVTGSESSPCNISSVLSNVNQQATKLTQSLGNCLSPLQTSSLFHSYNKSASDSPHSLNGVIGANHAGGDASNSLQSTSPSTSSTASLTLSDTSSVSDLTCQSARCRPVKHFRKRKLLRTVGLHQRGRKAARLSSVKCQCYPPVMSCPMCGGRYNNTQTVDSDLMSVAERISILDPAFHPVLSFAQEIPLFVHFESLLKSGEWQNKPPPRIVRTTAERGKLKALNAVNRTQNKKLQKTAVLLSSAKIRIKYENKALSKTQSHEGRVAQKSRLKAEACLRRTELKKRKAAKLARAALKKYNNRTLFSSKINNNHSNSSGSFMHEFGLLNSSSSSISFRDLKDAALRKRRESAYDINNIVIPYSIASSTRLEKLQYKEIVTPKWRCLSEDEESSVIEVNSELTKEELEDLSEDGVSDRHALCEADERKRFTVYHKALQAHRSRASRTDSTASETFSPDTSLTESSLSTAFALLPNIPNHQTDVVARRRTFSFSKSSTLSDIDEQIETVCEVDPWPSRTFPLCEEEYSEMKAILPPAESVTHSKPVTFTLEPPETPTEINSPLPSQPGSPVASTSSNCTFEEDPDDPEWTVREGSMRLSHSAPAKLLRKS